eukprot:m.27951 g.27951  ORF g.27951 m.27951 type:complete len:244 (+) comp4853_c0_seq2:112-843(+)
MRWGALTGPVVPASAAPSGAFSPMSDGQPPARPPMQLPIVTSSGPLGLFWQQMLAGRMQPGVSSVLAPHPGFMGSMLPLPLQMPMMPGLLGSLPRLPLAPLVSIPPPLLGPPPRMAAPARTPLRFQTDVECASCHTRRTPLWRETEDNVPLCNACGIRWKKYHIRCSNCSFIPRKHQRQSAVCPECNATEMRRRVLWHATGALVKPSDPENDEPTASGSALELPLPPRPVLPHTPDGDASQST